MQEIPLPDFEILWDETYEKGYNRTSRTFCNDFDLRGNDSEGKEEADEGQIDCQPGRIGQLQGASFRVRSTVATSASIGLVRNKRNKRTSKD